MVLTSITMKNRIHAWRLAALLPYLLFFNAGLYAQSPHPEDWEVGIRMVNLGGYFEQVSDISDSKIGSEYDGAGPFGWEVFGLKRLSDQTFWRAGIGFNYRNGFAMSETNPQSPENTTFKLQTSTLLTEIGYGYEFAAHRNPTLSRLRLRLGACLTANFRTRMHTTQQLRFGSGEQLETQSLQGGQQLATKAFAQLELRLLKRLFLGVEFRYGPQATFGKTIFERTRQYVPTGQVLDTGTSTTVHGLRLTFGSPIAIPVFNLGFSF